MNLVLMVVFVDHFNGSYMLESCSNLVFSEVVTSVFDFWSGQVRGIPLRTRRPSEVSQCCIIPKTEVYNSSITASGQLILLDFSSITI